MEKVIKKPIWETASDLPIDRYSIVGSTALPYGEPNDIDVICFREDIKVPTNGDEYIRSFEWEGYRVECLLADDNDGLAGVLTLMDNRGNKEPVKPKYLAAILWGHLAFPSKNNKWFKHIHDFHALNGPREITGIDGDINSYIARACRKATEARVKITKPKLKGVTVDEFFDNGIQTYANHDRIHLLTCYYDEPLYKRLQPDPALVHCTKPLWDKLSYWDKVRCVAEEVMTLSIERDLLPRAVKNPSRPIEPFIPKQSIKDRLMRVCTQTCSGYFSDFAILNYYKVLSMIPDDFYIEPIKTLLEEYERPDNIKVKP
jgi:hypothetical protein